MGTAFALQLKFNEFPEQNKTKNLPESKTQIIGSVLAAGSTGGSTGGNTFLHHRS